MSVEDQRRCVPKEEYIPSVMQEGSQSDQVYDTAGEVMEERKISLPSEHPSEDQSSKESPCEEPGGYAKVKLRMCAESVNWICQQRWSRDQQFHESTENGAQIESATYEFDTEFVEGGQREPFVARQSDTDGENQDG
mmetsp:Transcript_10047/g.20525  ORF Transcript_10047/g.20525 Transcript_10047/m.20525 type:complete len:137 (-) Transcript_10047:146-556(-)|eukprot:CAMPEP_0118642796 /NCGR_PEP_ID=MMETSP0785-20121206/6026_1 /TAXON_ID=91992 /ORGANISM="Bolidomonas pacifica, Strain CCMP 1866" /LENGTH=136 /DNA_ID=CAMNT_0006534371 /DNA_START=196 /DNA_END=606 /DNA_ORIENTATION=+